MRTTIEINDELLEQAKECARRQGKTLRALFEEALRSALASRPGRRRKYRMKRASFKGTGFAPGIDPSNWEQIRDIIYEGRGT
jgi:Arc/MetJ family transcription regulator